MRPRPLAALAVSRRGQSLALLLVPLACMSGFAYANAQDQVQAPLSASLPPDDLPDIGIDWPDLSKPETPLPPTPQPPVTEPAQPAPVEPAPIPSVADELGEAPLPVEDDSSQALLAAIDPTQPLRYSYSLQGLGDSADDTLLSRFDTLSALRAGQRERANIAQIRRRGRTDVTLLDDLLRARGYYDSRTRLDFRGAGQPNEVTAILAANPGDAYKIGTLDIDGLSGDGPGMADIRALFTVKPGDRADTDAINGATAALRSGMLERGYPFSEVSDPVLVVQHEQHSATLNMTVTTGGYRRIGKITVNSDAPFGARHVGVISRFSQGDPYRQADLTDLNRALVATGLVSQVSITPQPGANDETVDLDIKLGKAPVHTIAGEVGYGTGEGMRVEASWQHRNFFPPEGALTVRGVLGQQEQSATATVRWGNFGRRDRVLNVELSAANLDQPAYQAKIAGISASLERQTNLIFQKDWTWSLGAELKVSDERDLYGSSLVPRRRTYGIFALPSSLNYDGSDDLLDPRKGFRLGGRISPELSLQGNAFGYVRAQIDGSYYLQASKRVTIAGRARLGTIVGASSDRIAPTRRYYAGGGGSVRGYGYQAIGPRDANNDPIGGRSLGEVSIEARFRFGSADQFGIVPFVDAGTISADPWPSIKEMRVGAGLGFRYYSNFGPIRIDIGTPINPQPGDSRIGVYVSLGQAF
ncbi:MAG: BamA/TamA family outer membrane protein [Sphingobium sp.]|nr:BamA/TamA family outer membrane protein [Sphingobium sp.]